MLKSVFGSGRRVWITFLSVQVLFLGGGYLLQKFILERCESPGLALVLLGAWFALAILASLATGVWLGYLSGGDIFIADFIRDEMAEFDARLDGHSLPEALDDDNEAVMLQRIRGGGKFTLYWLFGLATSLLIGNTAGGQFLQTFSHPGLAIIQLRNADPNLRRRGIEALLLKSTERNQDLISEVVIRALDDANEGVVARAIHVAGQLSLNEVIPRLEEFSANEDILRFSALMSLGLMSQTNDDGQTTPHSAAQASIRRLGQGAAVNKEPEAFAYAVGLLKVPMFGLLRRIYDESKDERERLASVWASAQMRDPRLAQFFERSLLDTDLSVRCAAIDALEQLALPETAPALMRHFEALVSCTGEGEARECEPKVPLSCPEVVLPVQEGGAVRVIVKRRDYFLAVVRGLAATEHPRLLQWLVRFQLKSETNYLTWLFMSKVYDRMQSLDKDGTLSTIRQRLKQIELLRLNPSVKINPTVNPVPKVEPAK